MPVVEVTDVVKDYRRGGQSVRALDGVSVTVDTGEFVSIMGPSGAGKSTLLHLLGGLDAPSAGVVRVAGADLGSLGDELLTEFRRRRVGFVFQFFNLLPTLSAWENVALPRLLDRVALSRSRARAGELLDQVGIGHRAEHRPAELSGGELQRVAIARALIAEPALILADEPTGNLDSATGATVLEQLRSLVDDGDRCIVMVTHDARAASFGTRVVELADGHVVGDHLTAASDRDAVTERVGS